jgi:hypothetical protein
MSMLEKHNEAMDLAEEAFTIIDSNAKRSIDLFRKAYSIERSIADTLSPKLENEPSRAILYKSAASLALNAKLYREAEKTACLGLVGFPEDLLLEELRDILDQANFERHLKLNEAIGIITELTHDNINNLPHKPTCPFCGHENEMPYDGYEDSTHYACDSCDKPYSVEIEVRYRSFE